MRLGPRTRAILRPAIRVFGSPASGLAATVLRLGDRRVGFALLYHGIGEPRREGEEIVRPHPPRLFAEQVRHARRWYRVVDAGDLLDAVASRRRGERFPIAITFDDDLPEHVRTALPILRDARAQATFFLCGSSLERPFSFWWQRLQRAFDARPDDARRVVAARSTTDLDPRAPIRELALAVELMPPGDRDAVAEELGAPAGPDPDDAGLRAGDVQALVAAGMTIGFHTLRHDALTLLDDDALARAFRVGVPELERVVGRRVETVAYPHGRTDRRVAAEARAAGFRVGFACEGRPAFPDSDPFLVPRIEPSYRSAGHFGLQLLLALRAARPQR